MAPPLWPTYLSCGSDLHSKRPSFLDRRRGPAQKQKIPWKNGLCKCTFFCFFTLVLAIVLQKSIPYCQMTINGFYRRLRKYNVIGLMPMSGIKTPSKTNNNFPFLSYQNLNILANSVQQTSVCQMELRIKSFAFLMKEEERGRLVVLGWDSPLNYPRGKRGKGHRSRHRSSCLCL